MDFLKIVLTPILCLMCFQSANAGWTRQDSGTLAWLRSIYFVNQQRGWIAGSKGTLLSTADGGKTWRKDKKFTDDNIGDVFFSDEQNGWLLCERNIYSSSGSPSYLMVTSDGGTSWQSYDFPGGRERISRLFFAKSGKGFAVGEGGAIWRMMDDKRTWTISALPVRYLMLGGTFTDDFTGVLTGGGGTILVTRDAGLTWKHSSIAGGNEKIKLNSVYFADQTNGWTAGAGGSIYFTNNGGHLWRKQISNVSENLSDIYFINNQDGFAVGDNGIILNTANAGDNWKIEQTGTKSKLERVFFVGEKGFAVGFGGTILTYNFTQ